MNRFILFSFLLWGKRGEGRSLAYGTRGGGGRIYGPAAGGETRGGDHRTDTLWRNRGHGKLGGGVVSVV